MKRHPNRLRWWFPVLTLIFLSLGIKARLPDEYLDYTPLYNNTLSCLIIPSDIPERDTYSAGYHYQILSEFVKEQNGSLHLTSLPDSISVWEALLNQMARVVVWDAALDTIPEYMGDCVTVSHPLNSKGHVWLYLKEDFEMMQAMNRWFHSFKHTEQFARITYKFHANREIRNSDSAGGVLSLHDDAIKRYSKTIGWDWRMMAALIYQESTFQLDVISPKGAIGLMQVLPGTAEKFGVDPKELYDPEENIKAGTLFLREISRQFRDTLISDAELTKFILAAYNAGPEQIKDCRNFAAMLDKDPDVWSEVADVIPLMRENDYAHLVKRRFRGDETIRFVEEVLARYEWYCGFNK